MRTVSFSPAPVRKMLQDEFICQLINTTGDPSAGASIGHAPHDSAGFCTRGIGKQNVQCLFLTPQGEIFHTASGFRGPEDMQTELEFALATFEKIRRQPSKAKQLVRDVHIQRLRQVGFSDDVILNSGSPFSTAMFDSIRLAQQFSNGFGKSQNPMGAVNEVFAIKGRESELSDGRFAIQYPLLPMQQFMRDPRLLVGHETSAFQSVGNGGASGGLLGR